MLFMNQTNLTTVSFASVAPAASVEAAPITCTYTNTADDPEPTPTPTPTDTSTPTPTPTPTDTSTPTPTPSESEAPPFELPLTDGDPGGPGALPLTGSGPVLPFVILGGGLLLVGALTIGSAMRSRKR